MLGRSLHVDMKKCEIDTPALIVDLDAMERNIAKMAEFFEGVDADLRPHIKTHKTPIIAQKQIEAGAIGVTCAKLGEAEAMIAGGIQSILIANEIVTEYKIRRLVNLSGRADIIVAVDDPRNVDNLAAEAVRKERVVNVIIEINVGANRCGVYPGKTALSLAQKVDRTKGLKLMGLMGYEGGRVMFIKDFEKRKAACEKSMKLLMDTAKVLENAGINVEIVSGGGTGTYNIAGQYPGITEVQAGSYVLMDTKYRDLDLDFDCALTVLSTVISKPDGRKTIIDAGRKAVTYEFGLPEVKEPKDARVTGISDEHATILLGYSEIDVGDKLELIPSHCCTTVNLFDKLYGIRKDKVEAIWDITGRGKVQ